VETSLSNFVSHKPLPVDNAQLTTWMEAVAGGDQAAFRQLTSALGQRIFAMAYRLVNGDRAAAEDAVQDVLIKIWQTAPRWKSGGSVVGFISRLTYTTCIDAYRRKPKATTTLEEDRDDLLGMEESSTSALLRKEQNAFLLEAIDKLPKRQQEAIILTYFHENERREVAQTMATTEKAVEHLIARGLKTLAQHLPEKKYGGTHG
jgi:RNA polymerase sigma-70 factor (ECF subfamily)